MHDFFELQPVKEAAVYFMRVVLHDWPDEDTIKILKNTRAAAGPSSKLIVFDICIQPTCPDTEYSRYIDDYKPVPYPLLANYGMARGAFDTFVDMQVCVSRFISKNLGLTELLQMMCLLGGQERTVRQCVELGNASGWKLESVKLTLPATFIFSPV